MKRIFALLALTASAALAQTPTVTQILNNYSLINAGSVAQGAIFIVKGTALSDQTTSLQSVPLQTTLVGVQMEIRVGSTTTFAPMYYALPTQLAGILPSNTPLGSGTLIVRNNGKSSAPAAISVVRSAFGMLTVSGAGTGAARLQDASQGYQELSASRATNPGNFLVFYGSGVGATAGNETVAQTGANASGDLTSIPITVTIGGKNAPVFYRGRTAFPGLDQINVQVPALDTYGCEIPIVIVTNNVQANITTIPVAASGTTCPPPTGGGGGGGGGSTNPTQSEIDSWVSRGRYTSGGIGLNRSTSYSAAGITKTDSISAQFTTTAGPDLGKMFRGEVPPGYPNLTPGPGGCVVYSTTSLLTNPYPNLTHTNLDAGAQLTSSGPNGTQFVPRLSNQVAGPTYSTANLPNTYLNAGRYALSGPGGTQVGSFSGNLDVVADLIITNTTDLTTAINRSTPLTVRWTGGAAGTYLTIIGTSISSVGETGFTGSAFVCIENTSAGQFTVPVSILSQLPASGSIAGFSLGGIFSVTAPGAGVRLNAPSGVDIMTANNYWFWSFTPEFR
jgi:uncharacterized protein (TIGR03437 family)